MNGWDSNIGGYLQEAFACNRAAHAYIVVGDSIRLPELLKQCAAVCLCAARDGQDNCHICKKVSANLHQDVLMFPTDKRLTVADIAQLVEECYKRPVEGGDRRVFLVNAANSAQGVASASWQNKLLKTLEEPVDNVYIFIGVTDAEALLPTVRSRCQVLKQTVYTAKELCEQLAQSGFVKEVCEIAVAASNGSLTAAENILVNPAAINAFKVSCDILKNMTSTKNALQYVSSVLADKDNIQWYLKYMTVLLHESIVYRLAEDLCVLPSYSDDVEKICHNYSLQAAEVCIEKINDAKKRLDDNGNLTVVLDQLFSTILEVKYRCRI